MCLLIFFDRTHYRDLAIETAMIRLNVESMAASLWFEIVGRQTSSERRRRKFGGHDYVIHLVVDSASLTRREPLTAWP